MFLAVAGVLLMANFQQRISDIAPVIGNWSMQGGLAMAIGALLRLYEQEPSQ